MASKFHKNAIITGSIDSYCLVCESHLRSEEDIEGHIAKPIHKKNLDSTIYLEKFKEDCIRKVKKGYYCEFCNLLFSTAAKVGLHVVEAKHIDNKGTQLLKLVGNSVIAYEDVMISENAWNGITDETCTLCNTEFDNEDIHRTEPTHILNLVQNKVEFGADKSIYRKIDESSIQCLTCNLVLANTMTAHFEEPEHKKLYSQCRQTNLSSKTTKGTEKQTSTPLFKPGFLNQTPKTETTIKKPENSEKSECPLDLSAKPANSGASSTDTTVFDIDDDFCKTMGAKNYITRDENDSTWCIICDWAMDGSNINSHVYGRHHQTMLRMHRDRLQKKLKTVSADLKTVSEDSKTVGEDIKNECKDAKSVAKDDKLEGRNAKIEKDPSVDDNDIDLRLLDSVDKFRKNSINMNFETEIATCKKCYKIIDFNYVAIENHLDEHKKKVAKKETKSVPVEDQQNSKNKTVEEPKKLGTAAQLLKRNESEEKPDTRASSAASSREMDEEAEKFAKANDLAYKSGGTKVYCRICDSKVPSSLKNMKEHIAGISHKNKAARIELKLDIKPVTIKTPTVEFIRKMTAVQNGFFKDVVINDKYVISLLSFMMVMKMDFKLRCLPCNVDLRNEQLDIHKNVFTHEKAMSESLVIASMDSEFVREVRPNVFHCGFCNSMETSLEDLEAHMQTTAHRESKTGANWRLQQYASDISQHEIHRMMEGVMIGAFLKCPF